MLSPMLLPIALNLLAATSPAPARAVPVTDPPVKVWLSSGADFRYGEKAKAYAQSAEDGYLVVLHADTHGRIRVLFPVDPGDDQFVKGGKKYEIKGRGNREAFVVDDSGHGVVFAAFSKSRFGIEKYTQNGHWDYRALVADTANGDLEVRLQDIVHEMQPAEQYAYDAATYVAGDARYASRRGAPGWGGGYGRGPRVGLSFGFGRPFYSRGFGYDPYYFDPFYRPFGFGYGYGYGWGGIRSWSRR